MTSRAGNVLSIEARGLSRVQAAGYVGVSASLSERPYTPQRLAERWECSPQHVRKMLADGCLKGFKLGKRCGASQLLKSQKSRKTNARSQARKISR